MKMAVLESMVSNHERGQGLSWTVVLEEGGEGKYSSNC
jgi:hypothetical protein